MLILTISALMVFSYISCNKEAVNISSDNEFIELRRSSIFNKLGVNNNDLSVYNGDMLYFKDNATFIKVMDALDSLRDDSVFVNKYLLSIGFTDADEDSVAYPWEPALASFATNFPEITFLGTSEENREKQFYLDGGNPANFDKHFIRNVVKQFLLNDKLEVKVGAYIYKLVDRFNQFLIRNDDINALNTLRNVNDLKSAPFIENTILLNSSILEDIALYKRLIGDKDSDFFENYWASPPCKVEIQVDRFEGTNTYRIIARTNNILMDEFTWEIKDATGTVVYSNTNDGWFKWTAPNNNYPFTITVEVPGGKGCIASDTYVIDNACDCTFDYYVEEYWEANNFKIYFKGVHTCDGLNLQVDWGDGTVQNYSSGSEIPYHHYSDNSVLNLTKICVTLTTNTGCNNTICKTIFTGCGFEPPDKEGEDEYHPDSPRRKIEYELYVDYPGFFSTDATRVIGEIRNYAKNWFWWYKIKTDKLEVKWVNNSKVIWSCSEIEFCDYGDSNTNKKRLKATCASSVYDDEIVTVKPGYVTAEFYVTYDGDRYGPFTLGW